MKKDLLVVGALVVLAALGIGVVVVLQAMQPEDDGAKTIKPKPEPIAQLPKQDVKKTPEPAPAPKTSDTPAVKPATEPKPEEKTPKVEPKVEPKQEPKVEQKVKVEPKIEVKVEPKKPMAVKVLAIGNDIKLNDPDGTYTLKLIHGGDKFVLQGKIKTLKVAGVNGKSILDATMLEADEIIFTGDLNSGASVLLGKARLVQMRGINNQSTLDGTLLEADEISFAADLNSGSTARLGKARSLKLRSINDNSTIDAAALDAQTIVIAGDVNSGSSLKLHAPKGTVEFAGQINERAQVDIVAPEGRALFKNITGNAKITVLAKDVALSGQVYGMKTTLEITLTKDGSLTFKRLNEGVRLHYRKADASDPEPRIDAGTVGDRADFRQMPPPKK